MTSPTARDRRRNRNRQAILDAARSLILEEGLAAVSLRRIAARADFSPAGLYEYFENKDALLAELAARTRGGLRDALRGAVTGDALADLEALGLAYIAWARAHPGDYLLAFGRLRSRRRNPSEPLDPESAFAVLTSVVEAAWASARPDLAPGVGPHELAYGLWAHVHGAAMLQLTHLEGFEADFVSIDRMFLRRFLAGLGLREGRER